jgi:hypothetical protein
MRINPSNYVKKNEITQSYSLNSHQNVINPFSLSTNSPPKDMEQSNRKDSPHSLPSVMTKTYEVHPNGQFEFRKNSDRYIHPFK